ncbi:MAG TPA: hypothetical protein VGJ35_08395 [Burkholderiaceae bacterium]
MVLAGCATPVVTGDETLPVVATLPLHAAHIVDARVPFTAAFQRELDARPPASSPREAVAYLHGPAANSGAPTTTTTTPAAADLRRVSVLIAPGLFGDCFDDQAVPFGDGVVRTREEEYTQSYRIYDDMGLAGVRTLRVSGRASSAANAVVVARELVAEAARNDVDTIILFGYSKGAPDMLEALANLHKEGRLPAKLRAVVSVSGVVMGTLVADRYNALYESVGGVMRLAGCTASTGGDVESLMRPVRNRWLAQAVLPTAPRYYTVAAYAARNDIAPGLRASYDVLNELDWRNDGQVLVSDAMLPNSTLLAVANSDHWNYVLPLAKTPRPLLREVVTGVDFPREAFFRAIVRTVSASPPR